MLLPIFSFLSLSLSEQVTTHDALNFTVPESFLYANSTRNTAVFLPFPPFNSNTASRGCESCRIFTFRIACMMGHGSPEWRVCLSWRTVNKPVAILPV